LIGGIHCSAPHVVILVVAELHIIWIDCHFAAVIRSDEIRELTVVADDDL
jgi:hypothetical protein